MRTTTGASVELDEQAFQELEHQLRGRLIRPEDPDYEEARTIYNAMIDKRPGAIARCANVGDVMRAVAFARDNHLLVSIRGGGHNGPGLALCDGGMVIDLSPMKGIRVDPDARVARVEPGCQWGDVDSATHAFGLATVSGIISSTGVGGLTLGGGHGYLTRKYGLTIDNLSAADVVLASGQMVRASAGENPDLFWAIRGGGGNFGVVTSFEFRLHPLTTVIGGPMFWSLDEADSILRFYRDLLPNAPDDLYGFFLFAEVPAADPFPRALHNRKVCGIQWCHTGAAEAAGTVFDAARQIAAPIFEHVGEVPYPMLQSMFDGLYRPGLQWYWKGDFVREIPDQAIAEHLRFGETPTTLSTMHLYPIDGAASRVGDDDTAWAHRDAHWSMVIAGVDPDPANRDRITDWARDYWGALHPYCEAGAYVNFMMEEGADRVRATYGEHYERLTRIKRDYDPENLFRVNQNIEPASG